MTSTNAAEPSPARRTRTVRVGTIEIGGAPVPTRGRNRPLQMVFQDPYSSLDPRMSVGESIAEAIPPGSSRRERRAEVERLLELVHLDPARARVVECGVLVVIMAISAITGIIATILMMRSYREGTLVFKDLIFPQWWLDWIIPLTSLAMLLQALELLVTLIRKPDGAVPLPAEGVPGIRPEEMP